MTGDQPARSAGALRWRQALVIVVLGLVLFSVAKGVGIDVGNLLITFVIVALATVAGVGLDQRLPGRD